MQCGKKLETDPKPPQLRTAFAVPQTNAEFFFRVCMQKGMSHHFIEGLRTFYAENPTLSVDHRGVTITNPPEAFEKSLNSLCNNPNFVVEHPHLSRSCCAADMFSNIKRSRMTEDDQELLKQRLDACWMINSGTKPYDDTSILTHKAFSDHVVVTTIANNACMDVSFNNKHTAECCTSPGLVLGSMGDSEQVARACGLARR